jgi:hypothetical protein
MKAKGIDHEGINDACRVFHSPLLPGSRGKAEARNRHDHNMEGLGFLVTGFTKLVYDLVELIKRARPTTGHTLVRFITKPSAATYCTRTRGIAFARSERA